MITRYKKLSGDPKCPECGADIEFTVEPGNYTGFICGTTVDINGVHKNCKILPLALALWLKTERY